MADKPVYVGKIGNDGKQVVPAPNAKQAPKGGKAVKGKDLRSK